MSVTFIEPYVRPTKFFATPKVRLSWRMPLLAALVLAGVPFARIGLGDAVGTFLGNYFAPHAVIFAFSLWQTPVAAFQQQVVLLPFYVAGFLLFALYMHCLLLISGGKNGSYAATLRCVCYAAPCFYLSVFPYSGTLTTVIYTTVFLAYSLRAAHRTSWSRVLPAVALTIPVLFMVCSLLFP